MENLTTDSSSSGSGGLSLSDFLAIIFGIVGAVGSLIAIFQYFYTKRKDRWDSKDRLVEVEIDRVWDLEENDEGKIKTKKRGLDEVKEAFSPGSEEGKGEEKTASEKRV